MSAPDDQPNVKPLPPAPAVDPTGIGRGEKTTPPSWLFGLGALLLYLGFPSHDHNFDGVACAVAVELGDFKHLLHGNHLIYGMLGYLFHLFLHALGLPLRAIWSLQVLESLLGALAIWRFHRLLAGRVPPAAAGACAAGLALSYGFWRWSLEANVYMLSLLLLLLGLEEALDGRRPYRLALWHALAMLAHGANVLWTPVALYGLWGESAGRRERVARYLVLAALLVLAAYAAAASLWVKPRSLPELRLWLLGSAALSPDGSFGWHGSASLGESLRHWFSVSGLLTSVLRPLALPLWLAAPLAAWRARKEEFSAEARRAVACAWLWLACYAAFFIHWEPYTLVYRVSDLVPLWLLLALAFARAPAGARRLVWLWIAAFGLLNFHRDILPKSDPHSNGALQEALWIGSLTPEDAWVAAEDMDQLYLPYFAHRRPLNLRYYRARPEALEPRVRELLASAPVYASSKRLEQGWEKIFRKFKLEAAGGRGETTLYRVTEGHP